MSYREENGQVILTIDKLDWELFIIAMGAAITMIPDRNDRCWFLSFVNRLNSGNPNYTPYQTGEKS